MFNTRFVSHTRLCDVQEERNESFVSKRVGRARPGTMDDDDASHDDDDDGRIAASNRDGDRSIDSRDDSNSNSNSNRGGIHSFIRLGFGGEATERTNRRRGREERW